VVAPALTSWMLLRGVVLDFFGVVSSKTRVKSISHRIELYRYRYTQLQKGCSIQISNEIQDSNEIQSAKHRLFSSNISEKSILD